jgi:hypothetical protein
MERWVEKYLEFGDFVAQNDRLPKYRESSLYAWMCHQKVAFKSGLLSEEKIELLESIFYWEWRDNVAVDGWQKAYERLENYLNIYGAYPNKQEKNLSRWVYQNKRKYASDELHHLKIKKLENLPGWTWKIKLSCWKQTYMLAKTLIEKNVPEAKLSKRIKNWIQRQKTAQKYGRLDEERVKLLESIENWSWYPPQTFIPIVSIKIEDRDIWNYHLTEFQKISQKNHIQRYNPDDEVLLIEDYSDRKEIEVF